MKNHRRKQRKKKGKTSQGRAKGLSSTEENEVNPIGVEEGKEDDVPFTLVCKDPYSFYERTSLRQASKKEGEELEATFREKCGEKERRHVMKGQNDVSLPPLKEDRENRKRLTFHDKRAIKHSILDSNQNNNRTDVKTEGMKNKLALSLSLAGIYDLEDMRFKGKPAVTKENKKLKGILKSVDYGGKEIKEMLDKAEATTFGVTKCKDDKNANDRTKYYVIKTLTLEAAESPANQRRLAQDRLVLPRIQKKFFVSTRSNQRIADEYKAVTKPRAVNRLPRIGENENKNFTFADSRLKPRNTHGHRRKQRVHDNSFEQVYQQREMPQLPVLVNGRLRPS